MFSKAQFRLIEIFENIFPHTEGVSEHEQKLSEFQGEIQVHQISRAEHLWSAISELDPKFEN